LASKITDALASLSHLWSGPCQPLVLVFLNLEDGWPWGAFVGAGRRSLTLDLAGDGRLRRRYPKVPLLVRPE
jgi:hypothetical protein